MTLRFSYYRIRNYYYTGGHDCGGPDMEEDIRHLQRVAEFGSQEFCLEDRKSKSLKYSQELVYRMTYFA